VHQQAFDLLKQDLVSTPVLALPQLEGNAPPLEVVSDASQFASGAVLIQAGRPVAYLSKTFNQAERGYHTTEHELLDVITALTAWRHYLLGRPFLVVTDHVPNVSFDSTHNLISSR
jgi:hypothetical protein